MVIPLDLHKYTGVRKKMSGFSSLGRHQAAWYMVLSFKTFVLNVLPFAISKITLGTETITYIHKKKKKERVTLHTSMLDN